MALPCRCPSSCPVAVRLCRTEACAVSQGAEADVEGITHLKALEGQPQDERWPLGSREGGLGLNPAIPSFSLPPPPPLSLPSPPLTLLWYCLSSHLNSDCAVQTEPVMVQRVRPESQMPPATPQPLSECL